MEPFRRKSFVSQYFALNPIRPKTKIRPDKLHDILKTVNSRFGKISPSNCSRNILAINSNLDIELDQVKQKMHTPDPQITKLLSELSFSPMPRKVKLPPIISSPLKKTHEKEGSISLISNRLNPDKSRELISTYSQHATSRLEKLNNIISDCQVVEKKNSGEIFRSERKIKKNKNYYGNMIKVLEGVTLEQGLIERCKEDAMEFVGDQNEPLMVAKALKGGKKVWKQNHIKFITNIDKTVHSVPLNRL